MRRKKALTNPNGANQWIADPRQQLFLAYYLDPKSSTFSNALQSALKAKFAPEYAENIMNLMPTWLSEKLGNHPALLKAERNLEEALDLPSKTQAMSMYGPVFERKEIKVKVKLKNGKTKIKTKKVNGNAVMVFNPSLLKLKLDTSQFVAERIGRNKWGPKEPEGGNILNVIVFSNDQLRRVATRVIGGGNDGSQSSEGTSD